MLVRRQPVDRRRITGYRRDIAETARRRQVDLHRRHMLAADQLGPVLGPSLRVAVRADIADALAALVLRVGRFVVLRFVVIRAFPRLLDPCDDQSLCQHLFYGALEHPVRHDDVAHDIAGLGAIILAVGSRLQADRPHLLGPLLVVIAAPARRPEMVLPQMDHFMGEGGEHFLLRPVPEVSGVQGDLIGHGAVGATKSIAAKIAVALLASLQRDKAVRAARPRTESGSEFSYACCKGS